MSHTGLVVTIVALLLCVRAWTNVVPRLWRGEPKVVAFLRSLLVSTAGIPEHIARRIIGAIPSAGVAFSALVSVSIVLQIRRFGLVSETVAHPVAQLLVYLAVAASLVHLSTLMLGRPRIFVCPAFRDPSSV